MRYACNLTSSIIPRFVIGFCGVRCSHAPRYHLFPDWDGLEGFRFKGGGGIRRGRRGGRGHLASWHFFNSFQSSFQGSLVLSLYIPTTRSANWKALKIFFFSLSKSSLAVNGCNPWFLSVSPQPVQPLPMKKKR